jgi:hypothetical protein
MDEARELYNDLQRFLRVSARIVSTHGELVNVGEEFTAKVTVTNQAYSQSLDRPLIVFLNPRILVGSTEYAELVKKPMQLPIYALPDDRLPPGESTSKDLKFKAKLAIEMFAGGSYTERIASIHIYAKLDYDSYFSIRNHADIYHDILPG